VMKPEETEEEKRCKFHVNLLLWHFDTVTDRQTDTRTHSIHRFCVANITVASVVYESIV